MLQGCFAVWDVSQVIVAEEMVTNEPNKEPENPQLPLEIIVCI